MKRTKNEKAITLIALIITIVVLLILAVVAISSIKNDGILGHATDAATDYNQAVKNEQDTLISYEDFLRYQSCPGHKYDDKGVCTECGYSCAVQGGHTYGEWTQVDCSKERTCSVCGNKETVTEHAELETSYTQVSETVHSKNEVCKKCDAVLNSVEEAHTFVNSSCICEYACTSHTYGEWTIVAQADCSTETNGSKERTCSVCGNKETETITYEHENTETSYTQVSANVHSKNEVCTNCGTVIDAVEEQHSFYEGDCECGYPCLHYYVDGVCKYCTMSCGHPAGLLETKYTSYMFDAYSGMQLHDEAQYCTECEMRLGEWTTAECFDTNNDSKCDGCGECVHTNAKRGWDVDENAATHKRTTNCPDCGLDAVGPEESCNDYQPNPEYNYSVCRVCGWYYSW